MNANGTFVNAWSRKTDLIKPNTVYTMILEIKENTLITNQVNPFVLVGNHQDECFKGVKYIDAGDIGVKVLTLETKESFEGVTILLRSYISTPATEGYITFRYTILEGDHTETPLEELPFVEGIESVGESELTDDGYEISGKSCGRNLFNAILEGGTISNVSGIEYSSDVNVRTGFIRVKPNKEYIFSKNGSLQNSNIHYFSKDKNFLYHETNTIIYTPKDCAYIRMVWGNTTVTNEDILQINEGTNILPYEPYQESTYSCILNEPLRSLPNGVCDTIDLETGVLTRRVGKVVFDGNYPIFSKGSTTDVAEHLIRFDTIIGSINNLKPNKSLLICDLFPYNFIHEGNLSEVRSVECISSHTRDSAFNLLIKKERLTTPDVAGLDDWLKSNPTTVYYELAEPTTEQLTPQRLKSFDETTHVISDNKLIPIVSTKIPTDLGAMVDTLSLRNRELEEVNEQQDELIDITMMATDEMYSMLEPLMEVVEPMGLLDCSKMAQMYVAMVRRGIKKIEDVPSRYQEEVREVLGIKIEEEEWGEDDGIK